jgi:phage shock protein A
MALGKAFIEVHADTAPFARELGDELDKIVTGSNAKVKASSRKLGEDIATETGEGIRRNRRKISSGMDDAVTGLFGSNNVLAKLAKGVVDTIDDGLSGLPAEIKVVLGAALVAVAPVALALGAGIASAITTGLLLGGGALFGVAVVSQFEEIRAAALDVFGSLRQTFLEAASAYTGGFYKAIDAVQDRFRAIQPELIIIFAKISRVVEPLVDAVFDLVEAALPGISAALTDIDKFIVPLRDGFTLIGQSVGNFFQTIANNEDAPAVLTDMLVSVSKLIDLFTWLTDVGLGFYGTLIDIGQALGFLDEGVATLQTYTGGTERATINAQRFQGVIQNTIAPLESENQAIEDLNRSIDLLTQLTDAAISNEIAFEQGIDDLTASLKENKDTLDLNKQAGRDNANALLDLARTMLETRANTIELTGDVAGAEAAFRAQREEVYKVAKQMGLTKTEVDKIIGALLNIPAPKQSGVTAASIDRLEEFNKALREAIYLQSLFDPTYNPQGPGGTQKYAAGGIVTRPTMGIVGEAGPEAIIPLNNPQRAAQVMSEAGLSGTGNTTVVVYIGNEQFHGYVATVADEQISNSARTLTYGTRGI